MVKLFDPHKYGFGPSQSARSEWRDMDEQGFITGLAMIAGKAIATNGILVVIERANDFVIGHVANWKKHEEPKAARATRKAKRVVETIIFSN
jgi:hypothetical protein